MVLLCYAILPQA